MHREAQLPTPTSDLERAKLDLSEHGYCLVADALTSAEVQATRSALVDVAFDDVDADRAFIDSDGANQRVWALLNRGDPFPELAEHPLALEMMDSILGGHPDPYGRRPGLPDYLLFSITANIAGPGGAAMPLHQDQAFFPFPWPPYPFVANIAWLLDDTTIANGATRVVPGSHKLDAKPGPEAEDSTVAAEAPAGTALVFEGRLWHGTGANTTVDQKRHVILSAYSKPWIRTQENHCASTDPEVMAAASPTLRRLIGLDLHASLGMINGLQPADLGIAMTPSAHHRRNWSGATAPR